VRRAGAFFITISLLAGLAHAKSAPKPLIFLPDTKAAGAPPLEGPVWTIESERFAARVALLDTKTRQAWLLRHTGSVTDPFAAPIDGSNAFFTFLVDLECRGDGRIYFQPIGTRMVFPEGDVRNPLDVETLHAVYGMFDKELPKAYEGILGKVLLQRPTELGPGARATGLLAFRAADMKAKRFRLELYLTGPTGEEMGFRLPYVGKKPEDVEAGK